LHALHSHPWCSVITRLKQNVALPNDHMELTAPATMKRRRLIRVFGREKGRRLGVTATHDLRPQAQARSGPPGRGIPIARAGRSAAHYSLVIYRSTVAPIGGRGELVPVLVGCRRQYESLTSSVVCTVYQVSI